MAEIPFLPAAREEFLAAADDYDGASPGLGEEFIVEVERAVARIATVPDHGSPYFSGTRHRTERVSSIGVGAAGESLRGDLSFGCNAAMESGQLAACGCHEPRATAGTNDLTASGE